MMRIGRLAGAVLVVTLLGVGGCDDDPKEVNLEAWRIRGTYRVTGYLCGETPVTGPGWAAWRITAPNHYDWVFSDDGLQMEIRIVGESCTWAGSYDVTYTSATDYRGKGRGIFPCTPSNAACHDFVVLTNGVDICGQTNTDQGPMTHTAVPEVGATMDITFLDDSWCADHGYAGQMTFRFERIE
jgi:hypothetical protein